MVSKSEEQSSVDLYLMGAFLLLMGRMKREAPFVYLLLIVRVLVLARVLVPVQLVLLLVLVQLLGLLLGLLLQSLHQLNLRVEHVL
jgi:hypothetical protein